MLKNSMTVCPDGTSFDAAGSITDIKCTAKNASPAIAGDASGLLKTMLFFADSLKLERKRVCMSWQLRTFQSSEES